MFGCGSFVLTHLYYFFTSFPLHNFSLRLISEKQAIPFVLRPFFHCFFFFFYQFDCISFGEWNLSVLIIFTYNWNVWATSAIVRYASIRSNHTLFLYPFMTLFIVQRSFSWKTLPCVSSSSLVSACVCDFTQFNKDLLNILPESYTACDGTQQIRLKHKINKITEKESKKQTTDRVSVMDAHTYYLTAVFAIAVCIARLVYIYCAVNSFSCFIVLYHYETTLMLRPFAHREWADAVCQKDKRKNRVCASKESKK